MTLKYYSSYLNSLPSSTQQSFLNDLQQTINEQFQIASDVYTIQEEQNFGKLDWQDINCRITHVLPDTNISPQKKSDDWRNIIFDNISHYYALGIRYQFDDNVWITVQSDYYHKPTASAIIRRCDSTFKFYDANQNLVEEPVIIDYDLRLTKLLFGKDIILPQGHITVICQMNDSTKQISINKRFMLSETEVYKVDYINNYIRKNTYDKTSVPLIYMTLYKDEVSPTDDVTNLVANEITPPSPTPTTGNVITPNETTISAGDTITYAVTGSLSTDTFTFSVSSNSTASNNNYVFTVLGNNSFSIKNINFDVNPLIISAVNNNDNSQTDFSFTLKGVY